jgi:hypothetical protein
MARWIPWVPAAASSGGVARLRRPSYVGGIVHRSGPAAARPPGSRLSLEVPDGGHDSLDFSRPCPAGVHYSEAQFKTLNTGRRSRPGSPPLRLPGSTARTFSAGTTTSTATAASDCTPPPTSTTATPQPVRAGRAQVPRRRLPSPPRALRPQAARPAETAGHVLDQPIPDARGRPLGMDAGCHSALDAGSARRSEAPGKPVIPPSMAVRGSMSSGS